MTAALACPQCGHRHGGAAVGGICIGCACQAEQPARESATHALARVLDTTTDALASAHETITEQQQHLTALHFLVGYLATDPDRYRRAVAAAMESGRVVPAAIRAEVGL